MKRTIRICITAALLTSALASSAFAAGSALDASTTNANASAANAPASAADFRQTMATYRRPIAWWVQRPGSAPTQRNIDLPEDVQTMPASTIKPLITLIALETGVLVGADEMLPWDGRRYANFPQWEKPMALNAAMQSSNESYFRTLAERIGRDRLAQWIDRVGYGNGQFGDDAKEFHDGVLLITAREQLEFVGRLGRGELPFSKSHLVTVRNSMRGTARGDVEVFGKTGTHLQGGEGVGWWIGWVERSGAITPFVLRVALNEIDGRDKRIALGLRLLELDGVLPPE